MQTTQSIESPSSLAPISPRSPMPFNIHAKPFIPEHVQNEMMWYDTKIREFKRMNKFIFDEEDDLKFILSLKNTPFEKVRGERLNIKTKLNFKPTLTPLKEVVTWADIVHQSQDTFYL